MASSRRRLLATASIAVVALLLLVLVPAAFSQNDGEQPVFQFTQDQARRGAVVYAAQCATCHGEELEGFGPFPPLVGARFR